MDNELDQLGERIAEQAAHLDAAKHRLLADLREFDERGGWRSQGTTSCAHWLAWRVGWDLDTARDHVRVARKLAEFHTIDDALWRGEVSYSKVRALLRVATPANESLLLDHARLMTASQLEKLCRKYALVQRHGQEPHPRDDEQRRYVRRRDTDDGMVKIEAVLHPEEAELVWRMLDHAAAQLGSEPESPARNDSAATAPAAQPPAASIASPPLIKARTSDDSSEVPRPLSAPSSSAVRPLCSDDAHCVDDSAEAPAELPVVAITATGSCGSDVDPLEDSAEARVARSVHVTATMAPRRCIDTPGTDASAEAPAELPVVAITATGPCGSSDAHRLEDSAEARVARSAHVTATMASPTYVDTPGTDDSAETPAELPVVAIIATGACGSDVDPLEDSAEARVAHSAHITATMAPRRCTDAYGTDDSAEAPAELPVVAITATGTSSSDADPLEDSAEARVARSAHVTATMAPRRCTDAYGTDDSTEAPAELPVVAIIATGACGSDVDPLEDSAEARVARPAHVTATMAPRWCTDAYGTDDSAEAPAELPVVAITATGSCSSSEADPLEDSAEAREARAAHVTATMAPPTYVDTHGTDDSREAPGANPVARLAARLLSEAIRAQSRGDSADPAVRQVPGGATGASLSEIASRSVLDRLLDEAEALRAHSAGVTATTGTSRCLDARRGDDSAEAPGANPVARLAARLLSEAIKAQSRGDSVEPPMREAPGATGASLSEIAPRSVLDRLLDEAEASQGADAGACIETEAPASEPGSFASEPVSVHGPSGLRQRVDVARRGFNRADALVSLAQRYLRGDRLNRSPIEITLTIPEASLRAGSTDPVEVGEMGESFVPAEAARRLSCDAGIVEVVEGEHGAPLSVGRKRRTIAGALKRALYKRDMTCTFPGCTHRIFLEGHHVKHWADGGETSLMNATLLCNLHHRYVHEYGYTIILGPDQRPRFRDPRGRSVDAVPARPAAADLGWPRIRAMNEPLAIDADTIAGPWDGTPVDYGRIVGHLVAADGLR